MYDPLFNSVLVEIDDIESKYGGGNDESMLGASFSKGTFVKVGVLVPDQAHPLEVTDDIIKFLSELAGKNILWNEGVEAGTVFDYDGKKYGFIYWWDIRGVLATRDKPSKAELKEGLKATK